ncbi:MAG: hypothetical protein R3Y12_05210 [Clostridia bacterium]
MAEFCLNCFNKISDTNLTEIDVICDLDFCENCKENKPCVIRIRTYKEQKLLKIIEKIKFLLKNR